MGSAHTYRFNGVTHTSYGVTVRDTYLAIQSQTASKVAMIIPTFATPLPLGKVIGAGPWTPSSFPQNFGGDLFGCCLLVGQSRHEKSPTPRADGLRGVRTGPTFMEPGFRISSPLCCQSPVTADSAAPFLT